MYQINLNKDYKIKEKSIQERADGCEKLAV